MKRSINLLPPKEQKTLILEGINQQLVSFGLGAIVSLVAMIFVIFVAQFFLASILEGNNARVDAKQAELIVLEKKQIQLQLDELNNTLKNFASLQKEKTVWSPYLMELARLLPPDVSLQTLTLTRETNKVELTGQAGTRESVLKLRENILNSEYFKNINFPLFNLESPRDVNWRYRFFLRPLNSI